MKGNLATYICSLFVEFVSETNHYLPSANWIYRWSNEITLKRNIGNCANRTWIVRKMTKNVSGCFTLNRSLLLNTYNMNSVHWARKLFLTNLGNLLCFQSLEIDCADRALKEPSAKISAFSSCPFVSVHFEALCRIQSSVIRGSLSTPMLTQVNHFISINQHPLIQPFIKPKFQYISSSQKALTLLACFHLVCLVKSQYAYSDTDLTALTFANQH